MDDTDDGNDSDGKKRVNGIISFPPLPKLKTDAETLNPEPSAISDPSVPCQEKWQP